MLGDHRSWAWAALLFFFFGFVLGVRLTVYCLAGPSTGALLAELVHAKSLFFLVRGSMAVEAWARVKT